MAESRMYPRLAAVLRAGAYAWFAGLALVFVVATVGEYMEARSFWATWTALGRWFSPLNFVGLLVNVVSLSPGIAMVWGAEKLNPKSTLEAGDP